MIHRFVTTAAAAAALLAASAAHAGTWNWSYTGSGVTASGTFTIAGNGASAEPLLSITGTRNGQAILGLVPLDSDPNYIYDNEFTSVAPYITEGGWLYNIGGAGADAHINIYFDSTDQQYHDLQMDFNGTDITDTVVSFNVTAVPEAATYGYMALGLVAMGAVLRRRRAA